MDCLGCYNYKRIADECIAGEYWKCIDGEDIAGEYIAGKYITWDTITVSVLLVSGLLGIL